MKKPVLVHGIWGLAAAVAFVVGAQWFPAHSKATGEKGGAQRTASSSLSGSRSPGGASPSRASGDRAKGGTTSEGVPPIALTTARIDELGEQLLSSNLVEQRLAFTKLLEGLTVENALQIREKITQLSEKNPQFKDFHYAWGAIAGKEAVLHGTETDERDINATLAGWASADPEGAVTWFASLKDNDEFDQGDLKWGLVHGLADGDPDAGFEMVANLVQHGDKHGEKLTHVVTNAALRSQNLEEASSWLESLGQDDLRIFARERVSEHFLRKDPEEAGVWAAQFNNHPEGSRLINQVSRDWARRDPKAAITWLESLDSSEGKSEGMGSAFSSWAKRSPEEAGLYIQDMAASPERDRAIKGYASRVVYEDPDGALAWANSIQDPRVREQAIVETGRNLYRHNAREATVWLAGSGLPSELRERITSPDRR